MLLDEARSPAKLRNYNKRTMGLNPSPQAGIFVAQYVARTRRGRPSGYFQTPNGSSRRLLGSLGKAFHFKLFGAIRTSRLIDGIRSSCSNEHGSE
jgi:hypothetical protein